MIKKHKNKIQLISFSLFFILIVSGLSFSFYQQNKKSTLSQEVRKLFEEQLKELPPPPFQKELGFTPSLKEIELGRMLFNDPVLSRNNDVSCATCHLTNHGFADGNRLNFGALGTGGPTGETVGQKWAQGELSVDRACGDDGSGFHCVDPMFRNSLSTINVIYRSQKDQNSGLLWDGRFGDLSFQVLLPIHTLEEMCGVNPVPLESNPFEKDGKLFDSPVLVQHSHLFDPKTGKQLLRFNSPPQKIYGIPSQRPDGGITIPARNECLAIAVAKIRKIPWYTNQFQKIYESPVSDLLIGRALATFVSSHVALHTPYDQFVKGKDALSVEQLEGLTVFLTPAKKDFVFNGKNLKGSGCVSCHTPPHFGGLQFSNIGVKGDRRSSLSRPNIVFGDQTGFFPNVRSSHGTLPNCHVLEDTIIIGKAAPDIGRAIATFNTQDCFKMRVPTLRNVIETYPYFHHGTETGRFVSRDSSQSFEDISFETLKQAVQFHLNGPFDLRLYTQVTGKGYSDKSFQLDSLIPWENIDSSYRSTGSQKDMDEYSKKVLLEFIAFGLYDSSSTQRGFFGNQVSHPKKVPSGLHPSITRDKGHQKELPPRAKF